MNEPVDHSSQDGKTSETEEGVKTPGGLPQEDVDDRPDVSSVKPEDYPQDQRAK
jgi:hypothetical protein